MALEAQEAAGIGHYNQANILNLKYNTVKKYYKRKAMSDELGQRAVYGRSKSTGRYPYPLDKLLNTTQECLPIGSPNDI